MFLDVDINENQTCYILEVMYSNSMLVPSPYHCFTNMSSINPQWWDTNPYCIGANATMA